MATVTRTKEQVDAEILEKRDTALALLDTIPSDFEDMPAWTLKLMPLVHLDDRGDLFWCAVCREAKKTSFCDSMKRIVPTHTGWIGLRFPHLKEPEIQVPITVSTYSRVMLDMTGWEPNNPQSAAPAMQMSALKEMARFAFGLGRPETAEFILRYMAFYVEQRKGKPTGPNNPTFSQIRAALTTQAA